MTDRIRRVVITGLGVIAPNGTGKDAFWQACVSGRSGIGPITSFDASFLPTRIAGEVSSFDPLEFGISNEEAARLDRGTSFALAAAHLALIDGDLLAMLTDVERDNMGVYIGTAMSSVEEGERVWMHLTNRGMHPPREVDVQEIRTDAVITSYVPGSVIAAHFGLHGPCAVFATGCSAGADAIGQACWAIQEGSADRMLAGGSDSAINAAGINVFSVMKALSVRNDAPEQASRPYDAERDGFVMAEGAGVLLLEEREAALARGAHIYAEVIAFVSNSNAYHMTALPEDGLPLQLLLRQAMQEAGITPQQLGYINSHGSSTVANERAETAAYKAVFGAMAHTIPISATKSMIGHTQGAASAIETIVTALALDQQLLPPTINQHTTDPECDLDYIPNRSRPAQVEVALTHSSGFGGVNTALVLVRPSFVDTAPTDGSVAHTPGAHTPDAHQGHPYISANHPMPSSSTRGGMGASGHVGMPLVGIRRMDIRETGPRRVVVTGMGVVAANGIGSEAFWHATSRGISGIRPIQRFPIHDLPIQVAGEIKDFQVEEYLDRKLANRTDRMTHLALAAVDEAMRDSCLALHEEAPERVGVVIANTVGGVEYVIEQIQSLHVRGPRTMSAYTAIAWLQVANAGQVSLRYGLQGYCKTPINDTAGGLDALGVAYRAIQRGAADILIAGGCEAPLHQYFLIVLGHSGRLALGDDPAAYRPFDCRANGLVLAEGAGICILEEYEHALRRGAHIYGEIAAYQQTNDACTLRAPSIDGARYAQAIARAMQQGDLQAGDLGYISLDGSALPAADLAETDALARVFGSGLDALPVSVPRTMTGHSFAAAGTIDTVTALLALEYGTIPPTINTSQVSPLHRLNLVREPYRKDMQSALIASRSISGVNSVLAIRKV